MNLGSFIIENYLSGSSDGGSRDGDSDDTAEKSICVTQLSHLFLVGSVVISFFFLSTLCFYFCGTVVCCLDRL